MECEEELQPEGETCNSNGIWPVSFSVDAPVCSMTSTSILGCNSSIYLSRACNPDCSIPLVEKPFNFVFVFFILFLYLYSLNSILLIKNKN